MTSPPSRICSRPLPPSSLPPIRRNPASALKGGLKRPLSGATTIREPAPVTVAVLAEAVGTERSVVGVSRPISSHRLFRLPPCSTVRNPRPPSRASLSLGSPVSGSIPLPTKTALSVPTVVKAASGPLIVTVPLPPVWAPISSPPEAPAATVTLVLLANSSTPWPALPTTAGPLTCSVKAGSSSVSLPSLPAWLPIMSSPMSVSPGWLLTVTAPLPLSPISQRAGVSVASPVTSMSPVVTVTLSSALLVSPSPSSKL